MTTPEEVFEAIEEGKSNRRVAVTSKDLCTIGGSSIMRSVSVFLRDLFAWSQPFWIVEVTFY